MMKKEEVRKKIYGYLKYMDNEKVVLKFSYPEGRLYLVKGLWPEYIEETIWNNDSRVWQILQRQCIFRLDEFRAIYMHPSKSCGCAFIISQPWDIKVHELPELDDYQEAEILDSLPSDNIEMTRITRYEFMQDVKNKKWE